jgi:hypothetical protein
MGTLVVYSQNGVAPVGSAYPPASGVSWASLLAASGNASSTLIRLIYIGTTSSNLYIFNVRSVVCFDTTSLNSAATVSAASISFYAGGRIDGFSPSLSPQPTFGVYASNPTSSTVVSNADYQSAFGSTLLSSTLGFSSLPASDSPFTLTLNSSGLAAISKGGQTKLGLRDVNYDVGGSTPAWQDSVYVLANAYAGDGSYLGPTLTVTFTGEPTVTTQAASSLLPTSVVGNGNITDVGGASVTRRGFCYFVGTSGDPTTANSVAFDDGTFSAGAYTKTITGLTESTNYRVRAYAVNSVGTAYGSTVQVATPSSTFVKSFNGVARASIKTFDGVASASIKTWNGIT